MIPCIHTGEKTPMKILFEGYEKSIMACGDCVNVIESAKTCEVISRG